MNRDEKSQVVTSVREGLLSANATFLVDYKGLTVGEMQLLRRDLGLDNASLRVAKVRLMSRAVESIDGAGEFCDSLGGQVALVFASGEVPVVAKKLVKFAKERENFAIKAGFFESKVLDAGAVITLATLPSREELVAMCAGALNAPIVGLARSLNGVVGNLARSLKGVVDKSEA